jgi:A/G-specific adenine glycosylase
MPRTQAIRRIRGPLIRWYRKHRRELPWRETRDPYAIWVSEIMLQQTQVSTVLPYYRRFLERFPDVHALAGAPEEAVLGSWSGLGYYRRARALHAAARSIVNRHGGRLPAEVKALRALPGIGRYTAGAIASMAHGQEEPVVDGNVKRVLSRILGVPDPSDAELWSIARELVRGESPGDLNQALMELGATLCTPRRPRCQRCPVRSGCKALAEGNAEEIPTPAPRKPSEKVRVAVALTRRGGRILLERPAGHGPLRGSWDLPAVEVAPDSDPRARIVTELGRRHGLTVVAGNKRVTARHGILHRRLTLELYECRLVRGRPSRREDLRWIEPEEITQAAVSGATRKLLAP